MKRKLQLLSLSIFAGCLSLNAQTTHNIDWDTQVGANASITVNVGDEIVWTVTDNMTHNVMSQDAAAPVGFGSVDLTNGQTYSFTFTSTTVFNYFCDYHPSTMAGTITVVDNASLEEQTLAGFSFYPNPATDLIRFTSEKTIEKIAVYNAQSQKVLEVDNSDMTAIEQLDVSGLDGGTYFLKVVSNDETGVYKMIVE